MGSANIFADDTVYVPAFDPLELEFSLGELWRPLDVVPAPMSVVPTTSVVALLVLFLLRHPPLRKMQSLLQILQFLVLFQSA